MVLLLFHCVYTSDQSQILSPASCVFNNLLSTILHYNYFITTQFNGVTLFHCIHFRPKSLRLSVFDSPFISNFSFFTKNYAKNQYILQLCFCFRLPFLRTCVPSIFSFSSFLSMPPSCTLSLKS